MQSHVASPVALDRVLSELEPFPSLARLPMAYFPARRNDLDARKRVREPERIENAGAVRADADAGAHLLELRGLLVDIDIDATPQQRKRCRKSAYAPADDGDRVGWCRHRKLL